MLRARTAGQGHGKGAAQGARPDDGSGVLRALLALRPVVEATPLGTASGEARLALGLAAVTEPGLRPAGPGEERLCAGLPPVRARDFLAGRGALRRALGRAGQPTAAEILYRTDGVRPAMPPGGVGSLSHSGGVAVALAAPATHCTALGVDLERHPLPLSAARLVLHGDERLIVSSESGEPEPRRQGRRGRYEAAGAAGGEQRGADRAEDEDGERRPKDEERRLRELFSAKESAFKALYGLLPAPHRPTTPLGIAIRPANGGYSAWARAVPERVLHVNARWVDSAVLTWTATDCPAGGTG
ncbi:hypothetical protein [Streptomyces sp. NPDC004065]|uniref:hypothetical protein n=1 Tax=Streptomyces sp. NPDC004065 TaxID=3364689 RepID=UPI00384E960A